MGKTGKWLKHLLTGYKKDKKYREQPSPSPPPPPLKTEARSTPASTPKEKKRWSFRRSSAAAAGRELNSPEPIAPAPPLIHAFTESDMDQKRHAVAVAVATAAAADAAVAAAQAAAAVVRLTTIGGAGANNQTDHVAEENAAAIRIQAAFRSYLARKALRALKGLVKLQSLVRGHLVRRQATATLRCMQALVTVQARARAQRIQMLEESQATPSRMQTPLRRSPQHPRFRQSYAQDMDRNLEENVKIVEMDVGTSKSRNSCSITQSDRADYLYSPYDGSRTHSKADSYRHVSPAPSALTDTSPRGCSGHFEEFSFATAQSSPHCFSATSNAKQGQLLVHPEDGAYSASSVYPFFPSYMANTESSRAKARSQSAPKQRPDSFERQPSRRRQSVEGRNIPRSVRMQRSSSHVGASVNGYQYPWSIKLDRSNVSLKDSECGSTSTVLTNGNYCTSLLSFEVHGSR